MKSAYEIILDSIKGKTFRFENPKVPELNGNIYEIKDIVSYFPSNEAIIKCINKKSNKEEEFNTHALDYLIVVENS